MVVFVILSVVVIVDGSSFLTGIELKTFKLVKSG